MNYELVDKFISDNFNQDSAISKIKYYNPNNLAIQHLPVKENVKFCLTMVL